VKPHRVGGWKIRDKLKMGRGGEQSPSKKKFSGGRGIFSITG
jgi:hypothetical protein